MPLGRGILEAWDAIPRRTTVTGQAPTWRRIAGSSFDAVRGLVKKVRDDLREPSGVPGQRRPRPAGPGRGDRDADSFSSLEEIFAHQEEVRRHRDIPGQRRPRASHR